MTVDNVPSFIKYPYNGPGAYTFPFKIFTEDELLLTHTDEQGVTSELAFDVDYSVVLVEGIVGGTCNVINPIVAGGYLDIRRNLPLQQETDYVNNDPLNVDQIEIDFDRVVMLIQQLEDTAISGAASTNYRGDWQELTLYKVKDQVKAPSGNLYVCQVEHTSGTDFDTDLALGYWQLMLDVAGLEDAVQQAIDAALQAEASAAEALESAGNASISEINAANCAAEAAAAAIATAADAISTAADALEAYHWAQYPENSPVPESSSPPEYSSYHWAKKAEGASEAASFNYTYLKPATTASPSAGEIDHPDDDPETMKIAYTDGDAADLTAYIQALGVGSTVNIGATTWIIMNNVDGVATTGFATLTLNPATQDAASGAQVVSFTMAAGGGGGGIESLTATPPVTLTNNPDAVNLLVGIDDTSDEFVPAGGTLGQVLTNDGDGTRSWQDAATGGGLAWEILAADLNPAVKDTGYLVNSIAAVRTITLPAAPAEGDMIGIADYGGSFATNNVTIARNSLNIMGLAEDLTLDLNNTAIELVYSDATRGWLITSSTPVV